MWVEIFHLLSHINIIGNKNDYIQAYYCLCLYKFIYISLGSIYLQLWFLNGNYEKFIFEQKYIGIIQRQSEP